MLPVLLGLKLCLSVLFILLPKLLLLASLVLLGYVGQESHLVLFYRYNKPDPLWLLLTVNNYDTPYITLALLVSFHQSVSIKALEIFTDQYNHRFFTKGNFLFHCPAPTAPGHDRSEGDVPVPRSHCRYSVSPAGC